MRVYPIKPLHMTPPEQDVNQAIADIKLWADTPDPTFGTLANRPTVGAFPGAKWFATDNGFEYLWNGSAWVLIGGTTLDWTTYLPAVKYGGSATNVAGLGKYRRDAAGVVDFEVEWTSTGAGTAGVLSFTLPFALTTSGSNIGAAIGTAQLLDSGTGRRIGFAYVDPAALSTVNIDVGGAAYTNVLTNTNPWTVANGDGGLVIGRYPA